MQSPPQHCHPAAYHLLAEAVAEIETPAGLLAGALAIAMHEHPQTDPAAVDGQLQQIADAIRARVTGDSPTALLAHAHAHLFDELGYCGDAMCFQVAEGSYLPAVLARRRGLPISLSLVYKLVLGRLGLEVRGLNLPGHFIVAVRDRDRWLLVDPYASGRALSVAEATARARAFAGSDAVPGDDPLPPCDHRRWLRRMLRNLHALFLRTGAQRQRRAMLELDRLLDAGPGTST